MKKRKMKKNDVVKQYSSSYGILYGVLYHDQADNGGCWSHLDNGRCGVMYNQVSKLNKKDIKQEIKTLESKINFLKKFI